VEKIFTTQVWTYPAEGIFALNVVVRGAPAVVTIDDYLPYKGTTTKTLAYGKASSDGAIWGPILEKAFARTMGTYTTISGGQTIEALNFLTGAPGQSFSLPSTGVNATWALITAADQAEYVITCATAANGGTDSDLNSY
jgi:calpain-15